MTASRQDRVLLALNAILPRSFTWVERCDPEWLEVFPAGIAPLFTFGTEVSVCTERIAALGEGLEEYDFEALLDALVVFVVFTMIDYQRGLAADKVLARWRDLEPVEAIVLDAAARRQGVDLMTFMGADRSEFRTTEG